MAVVIGQANLRGLEKELKKLPSKVRKTFRGVLKQWGNSVVQDVQNHMTWKTKNMKRSVKLKIESEKRGTKYWGRVGVQKPKGSPPIRDPSMIKKPGWRAHMYDRGWKPYPKGKPHKGKGKGWRKGIQRAGGTRIYATRFISDRHRRGHEVEGMVAKAIEQVLSNLRGP